MTINIGEMAGLVWNYLAKNGETSLSSLKKNLELKADEASFAIGWLAQEEKVEFSKKGATLKVSLK